MERRLPQFFFALSLIALALMLAAVWQAGTPAWKTYQREFHRLEAAGEPNAAAKSDVLNAALVIRQDLLPGLQRVDRCTTCHLGVEDPTMKNAPQPFTFHPNLAPHVPAKFGCTVCHGGQGLATDKQNAHGKVPFWQEPLLPKEYIRASCGRCHKEGEVPGVPELTEGRRLFETQGCRGCHKLNGVGGTIGPDLTEEGASPPLPRVARAAFPEPQRRVAQLAHAQFPFHERAGARADLLHAVAHQRTDGDLLLERAADPQRRLWTAVVRRKELHRLPQHRRRGRKERARPAGSRPNSTLPAGWTSNS